mgnify:CR=1 FL=1
MTDIKLTYTQNTKGKYDFVAKQDGVILYEKTYSPIKSKNQHYMGIALVETLQKAADEEIEHNHNFKWNSFEEFKLWAGNAELRNRAVLHYHEMMLNMNEEGN